MGFYTPSSTFSSVLNEKECNLGYLKYSCETVKKLLNLTRVAMS